MAMRGISDETRRRMLNELDPPKLAVVKSAPAPLPEADQGARDRAIKVLTSSIASKSSQLNGANPEELARQLEASLFAESKGKSKFFYQDGLKDLVMALRGDGKLADLLVQRGL